MKVENVLAYHFQYDESMKKDIRTLDDMWRFIENILVPYGLMPKKADLTDEQVTQLYSELVSVDLIFTELEQVLILKRGMDDLIEERKNRVDKFMIDEEEAKNRTRSFLEYHDVASVEAILKNDKWIVTAEVRHPNKHVKEVIVDSENGKILGYLTK